MAGGRGGGVEESMRTRVRIQLSISPIPSPVPRPTSVPAAATLPTMVRTAAARLLAPSRAVVALVAGERGVAPACHAAIAIFARACDVT